jgi:membrane-associated phospholipid phosphatase
MQRRPGTAVAVGLAGIVLIVADWALAFHSWRGMWLDRNVLDGFFSLHHTRIGGIADALPHLSDPAPFLLWFLLIVGTALVRGRPRYALVTGGILLFSNLATHLLKPALGGHTSNIAGLYGKLLWPSGHATASMAVALCAILVAPARWRPLVAALGAVYTLVVSFTLMISGWHFPSDVVAGYLMAGTWTAFGVATLWAAERRWPAGAGRPTARISLPEAIAPALVVGVAGLGLFLLVTFARPVEVTAYASEHTAFVVGAGLIAALALSLVAALAAAMTNTPRRPRTGGDPAPTGDRPRRSRPGPG